MTEQSQWLQLQIDKLAEQQTKFTDRAFWLALKEMVREQDRRNDQLSGEDDGRTWRPDKW